MLKMTFEQEVKNGADMYRKLCDVMLECIEEVQFDEDTRKVFNSETVRRSLRALDNSIIKALELIAVYYSGTRSGAPFASLRNI